MGPDRTNHQVTAAQSPSAASPPRASMSWRDWGRAIALAAGVALLVKSVVVGLYVTSSTSMMPTVQPGDLVLVNKLASRLSDIRSAAALWGGPFGRFAGIERGDVVVFETHGIPAPHGSPLPRTLIKRCVAVPGDTVEYGQGALRVNGRELSKAKGLDFGTTMTTGSIRFVVPGKGDLLEVGSSIAEPLQAILSQEDQGGEENAEGAGLPAGPATPRIRLRHDYYFLFGDNLAYSRDSRSWGPVSEANFVGRAVMIVWSWDAGDRSSGQEFPAATRWQRIGALVR